MSVIVTARTRVYIRQCFEGRPRKMLANNNVITVILFILPNSALIDDTDWAGVTLTMNDPSSRT